NAGRTHDAGGVHIGAIGHRFAPSHGDPQAITKAAGHRLGWRPLPGCDRRLVRANGPPVSRRRQDARNLKVQLADTDLTLTEDTAATGATLGDYAANSKIGYGAMLKVQGRLTLCPMLVDVASEKNRADMPQLAFGSRLETLVVGVCVAIGHLEGKTVQRRQACSLPRLSAHVSDPPTRCPRKDADHRAKRHSVLPQ